MIRVLLLILIGLVANAYPQINGPILAEEGSFPTINVSSIVGIHQNSNLSTGGGTDDTSLIQAVLTAHPSGVILVQDGVSLITGLNLGSNTNVRINSSSGFYLANSSNREAFANVHKVGGNLASIVDHDITITGTGEINCNASGQSGQFLADGEFMACVAFKGVSKPTISGGLTIYNAAGYVVDILCSTNVVVDNVSLLQSTAAWVGGTVDSIDLRGPINGATLNNLTVLSGDDAIALNSIYYQPWIGIRPYELLGGNIDNVTISNINFSGAWSGIHLYSNTEYASFGCNNISISNLYGTVQNSIVFLDNDPLEVPGYGGVYSNISVSHSYVTLTGTPFVGSNFPTGERRYVVNGAVDAITFADIEPSIIPVVFWTSFGTATSFISNGAQLGPSTGPASANLAFGSVVFNPVQGLYGAAQSVALTSYGGATATYYTTNGSTPTTGSTLYTAPISVTATETIKAVTTAYSVTSEVNSSTYSLNLSGEVVRWAMDEATGSVMHDTIGSDNLALTGNSGSWSALAGVSGGAFLYNGSYAQESGVKSGTDVDYTQPFSVFAVVEPTSNPALATVIGNVQSDATLRGWQVAVYTGVVYCLVIHDLSTSNMMGLRGPTLSPNTLYDIVCTSDGTHTAAGMKMYVNGSPVSTAVWADGLTGTTVSTNPLAIGARSAAHSYTWVGYIGPVGIWDSVLTSGQVSALHSDYYAIF